MFFEIIMKNYYDEYSAKKHITVAEVKKGDFKLKTIPTEELLENSFLAETLLEYIA